MPRDLGEDEMITMGVMMMVIMTIVMVSSLIYFTKQNTIWVAVKYK